MRPEWVNTILRAASLAPSADNSLPWCFSYEEKRHAIILFIDESRSGGPSDQNGFLSLLAIGAAIETIVKQSQFMGVKAEVTLFSSIRSDSPVAEITLRGNPDKSRSTTLRDDIMNRCTDRRFPFKSIESTNDPQELINTATFENVRSRLYLRSDRRDFYELRALMQSAEAARFRYQILHEELISSVIFGKNHDSNDEGIRLPALHLDPVGKSLLKLIRSWRVLRTFNRLRLDRALAFFGVGLPLSTSPGLVLITVTRSNAESFISAGRALQGIWLELTNMSISVHPYAALGAIYNLKNTIVAGDPFLERNDIWNRVESFCSGEIPVIALRIGVKTGMPNRTGKRDYRTLEKPNL